MVPTHKLRRSRPPLETKRLLTCTIPGSSLSIIGDMGKHATLRRSVESRLRMGLIIDSLNFCIFQRRFKNRSNDDRRPKMKRPQFPRGRRKMSKKHNS